MTSAENEGSGSGEGQTAPKFRNELVASRLQLRLEKVAGDAVLGAGTILEGDFFRIGSHPSNDLVVNDSRVSRFHCSIVKAKHGWRVVDNGSLNGTKVSGVTVRDADLPLPECRLEIGESIVHVSVQDPGGKVEVLEVPSFGDLYGTSLPMRKLFAVLDRVSKTDANVLIEGESGTGKELVATEVVRRGPRAQNAFVVVDCGAIAPSLIESELFGHVRGAFTGAERDRVGVFEAASGGTVFLDEIGELPLELQPKLLRALEAQEIRRVGESKSRKVDVRVVAATNRRLDREVNQGRFREDLYFRLSVVSVWVPALRERLEDIEILINAFLEGLNATSSRGLFTKEVLDELIRYEWPGNVRELRNYVERTVVLQDAAHRSSSSPPATALEGSAELDPRLVAQPVDLARSFRSAKEQLLDQFERKYLTALLEWSEGNISRAARKAQMDRMNLHRLVQRYALKGSRSLKD